MQSFNLNPRMMMKIVKYVMLVAAALFAVGMPQADAAPKKKGKKKAKTVKKAAAVDEFDFDLESESDIAAKKEAKKAKKKAKEEAEAAEGSLSMAEKRVLSETLKEDTKFYMDNQRKTFKILIKVKDAKSALKAVPALEEIYGEASESAPVMDGAVTAMGVVKIFEEDETKLDVHIAFRAPVAALNANVNKELTRIMKLKIDCPKFEGVVRNMMDSQRENQ